MRMGRRDTEIVYRNSIVKCAEYKYAELLEVQTDDLHRTDRRALVLDKSFVLILVGAINPKTSAYETSRPAKHGCDPRRARSCKMRLTESGNPFHSRLEKQRCRVRASR